MVWIIERKSYTFIISASFALNISSISLIPLSISLESCLMYLCFIFTDFFIRFRFIDFLFEFLSNIAYSYFSLFSETVSNLYEIFSSFFSKWGIFIINDSPLLEGLSQILASLIPFSISFIRDLSHGCMTIVLASIIETEAIF